MRRYLSSSLLLIAGVLSSCVSPSPYRASKTESGKPEVLIASTDVDAIKTLLLHQMIDFGYEIDRDSPFVIKLKRNTGWSDSARNIVAAGGGRVDALGYTWVSYTLVVSNQKTWVVADAKVFMRPPFGGPLNGISLLGNNDGYNSLQFQLDALKAAIESAKRG